MTNSEKIEKIRYAKDHHNIEAMYYELLEEMGDLKINYRDYMITEPLNVERELLRLPEADYELCTALLTLLLREDHFCNGSLMERYKMGQLTAVLDRMIETLETE